MTYWQAVQDEMRTIQREEIFTTVEMIIHFESIMDEAIARLYVLGMYEEVR